MHYRSLSARAEQPIPSRAASPALQLAIVHMCKKPGQDLGNNNVQYPLQTIPGERKCRAFHDEGSVGRTWSRASKSMRAHPAKRMARRMRPHPPKYASHQASVLGSAFSISRMCALGRRTRLTPIQNEERERTTRSRTATNIKPFSLQNVWIDCVTENSALFLSYTICFVQARFFAKDIRGTSFVYLQRVERDVNGYLSERVQILAQMSFSMIRGAMRI